MSDATADMSLQESCIDAARHLSVEVHLLASKADELERENAKLREQVEQLHADQAHWELGNCPSCPNIADLQEALAENAKLRDENSRLQKYASKALSAISYCDCCPYVDCGCDTETVPMHEGCKAFEELSELGVEVE